MAEHPVVQRETSGDLRMERHVAERVLRRAGYSDEHINEVLAGISFPALTSTIKHRGAKVGISVESLMDRLGAGP